METFCTTTLSQFHTVHGLSLDAIEKRWRKKEQLRVRSQSSDFKALRVEHCRGKLLYALESLARQHIVEHIQRKNRQSHRTETLWRLVETTAEETKTTATPITPTTFNTDALQHKHGWEILRQKYKDGTLQEYVQSVVHAWDDLNWEELPEERAVKWTYSTRTCEWNSDSILLVKIHPDSFAKGAMRKCFRMKKYNPAFLLASTPTHKNWNEASPYVAKHYYGEHRPEADANDGQVYKDDIVLQKECSKWSTRFNDRDPPKQIEFVHVWLIQMIDREHQPYYAVERFIEGKYVKYNNNSEFVNDGINEDATALDENSAGYLRSTPQAFSHFTYEASNRSLMVSALYRWMLRLLL